MTSLNTSNLQKIKNQLQVLSMFINSWTRLSIQYTSRPFKYAHTDCTQAFGLLLLIISLASVQRFNTILSLTLDYIQEISRSRFAKLTETFHPKTVVYGIPVLADLYLVNYTNSIPGTYSRLCSLQSASAL